MAKLKKLSPQKLFIFQISIADAKNFFHMKFKLNQRGFILSEFIIALPLLILLLYALGNLTFIAAKMAREQVAYYVLETEAQNVIDRITQDARAAHSAKIGKHNGFDKIIFACHNKNDGTTDLIDKLDQRVYAVDNASGKFFHIYFEHQDKSFNNPITGDNFYGDTIVTKFEFQKIAPKVLHITLEMKIAGYEQRVKFSTAVYMPSCQVE